MKRYRFIEADAHKIFTKNILEILRISGLRQSDLATLCGWSRQTMSSILNQENMLVYQFATIMYALRLYLLTNPDKLDRDIISYSYKLYKQVESAYCNDFYS